jgi:hypothetical protein
MCIEKTVERFLKDLRQKLKVWQITFRDERSKNTQTLADLEILPIERKKIIESLTLEDYCQGPIKDELFGISDMWVFGKEIKHHELYIKVALGLPNNNVICHSFHISEHKLNYPLKH